MPHGLHRMVDPEDHGLPETNARLNAALPRLSAAAGAEVAGVVGSHDRLAAVQDALNLLCFDEVIVSILPVRLSRWLHLDIPHKIRGLGVPVTEVVGTDRAATPRDVTSIWRSLDTEAHATEPTDGSHRRP